MSTECACFKDIGCDDSVTLSTQYSTQWDGFAHIGGMFDADGDGRDESCYYNSYRAAIDIFPPEVRGERTLPRVRTQPHCVGGKHERSST